MNKISAIAITIAFCVSLQAKDYTLLSPDGNTAVTVSCSKTVTWSISKNGTTVLSPSEIALALDDGRVFGHDCRFSRAVRKSVSQTFPVQNFKRAEVKDNYNELTLPSKDFQIVFRAYDDGVAYRFVTSKAVTVKDETAEFRFPGEPSAWVAYARKNGDFEKQFVGSFQSGYEHVPLSGWPEGRLGMTPVTFEVQGGLRLCITDTDLLNYPGMFLCPADDGKSLRGVFAPVPKELEQGGHNNIQILVKSRHDYIYKGESGEALPWRTVIIAEKDSELLQNDMVFRLAKAPEGDFSWVKPGKVAWDWWNDWNLYGVDFRAGINNETYRYYIDFASSYGIEYVILDEGWSVKKKADLMQVVPEIDIASLSAYAQSKGVRLILWAGYKAFDRDMEKVCAHYAAMGIAGWKIDFMNRDDQTVVAFYEKAARTAAKYHQVLDFHGAFKHAGLMRTWPNVLNFEGVNGLEEVKWAPQDEDLVTYDVTAPFVRYVAGAADYTQGAMRNSIKKNFRAVYTEPMSQGTRCRQLAEYIIFDAPLTMLCDSPSNYLREPECTAFMASVPTVWDETVAIDGRIGEYVVMARRSGNRWYVAGMTDWDARDITVDLTALDPGLAQRGAVLFRDGINADRVAMDYKRVELSPAGSVTVHLAPGGGFVLEL